jgi:hypothetical protein
MKMVTRSKFHAESPQMLGATVTNFVARKLCNPDLNVKNTAEIENL